MSKTNNKNRRGLTIVGAVLIITLAVALLASMSGGFKNWDTKTWFGKTAEAEKPTEPEVKTYEFDFKGEEGEDFVFRKIECGEIFVSTEQTLKAKVKDTDGVETEGTLYRFTQIIPETGALVAGWTDGASVESGCGIVGFAFGEKQLIVVFGGSDTTLTIETTLSIKDLGVISDEEMNAFMSGAETPDMEGNTEVTE